MQKIDFPWLKLDDKAQEWKISFCRSTNKIRQNQRTEYTANHIEPIFRYFKTVFKKYKYWCNCTTKTIVRQVQI